MIPSKLLSEMSSANNLSGDLQQSSTENTIIIKTLNETLIYPTSSNSNYDDVNLTLNLPHMHNITFLLNVSRDLPEKLSIILFGYILPNLFALTIITNLLIVAVLSRQHMRTPTNLVLLGMAVADLLTLLIPSPWYIYLFTLGHHHESIHPVQTCYIFHVMYEVLPALFHTYSIWLTLLLAGQRYIYVCNFSLAKRWCTVPQVVRAMLIILVIAVLHQSTRFFDRVFLPVQYVHNGQVLNGCQFFTADWVIKYVGENTYYVFYYGFRIIFVHTGPCIILVWLNVLLFRALHQTQKTRKRLLSNSRATASIQLQGHAPTSVNTTTMITIINNANHSINNNPLPKRSSVITTDPHSTNYNKERSSNNPNDNSQRHDFSNILDSNQNYLNNLGNEVEDPLSLNDRSALDSPPMVDHLSGAQNNMMVSSVNRFSLSSPNVLSNQEQPIQQELRQTRISRIDSRSTTIMLIVIVTMFLFLEIPLALTTILHVVQNMFALELVNYSVLNTIIMLTNFFIIVSYPINFAIYCGMSRQFRITFYQSILAPMVRKFNWLSSRVYGLKYFRQTMANTNLHGDNNGVHTTRNNHNTSNSNNNNTNADRNGNRSVARFNGSQNITNCGYNDMLTEIQSQKEETNLITNASNSTFDVTANSVNEYLLCHGNEQKPTTAIMNRESSIDDVESLASSFRGTILNQHKSLTTVNADNNPSKTQWFLQQSHDLDSKTIYHRIDNKLKTSILEPYDKDDGFEEKAKISTRPVSGIGKNEGKFILETNL